MRKLRYDILLEDHRWALVCGQFRLRTFSNQPEAIWAAERAAGEAAGVGFEVELNIVEDDRRGDLGGPEPMHA